MENDDRLTIEGILLDGGYYGDLDEILDRETQKIENDRYVELDLSDLGLDEISEIIELLDELQLLDIRGNQITELPSEIISMDNLRVVKIAGNPIEILPHGSEHVDFDIDHPRGTESDSRTFDRTRKSSPGGKLLNKVCSWCDVAAGYNRQSQKSEGTWGFTKHYSRILICRNCGYMHTFYSGRML